jgi:hypothetical protein
LASVLGLGKQKKRDEFGLICSATLPIAKDNGGECFFFAAFHLAKETLLGGF